VKLPQILTKLAEEIDASGGRLYAVGGWVRDQVLGRDSKDVDCEVHGIELEHLTSILETHGQVNYVGKSFGVFKLATREGVFDISLPRTDFSVDSVTPDPFLGIERAVLRRDLRCNALMWDPISSELIDLVGGLEDIEEKRLRAVDQNRFGEDSLRVLRAARFSATLGFCPDEDLYRLCRDTPISDQPVERIWGELRRILLARNPVKGLDAIAKCGALAVVLPEIVGVERTELSSALQRAVVRRDGLLKESGRLCVMLAVLLHPLSTVERRRFFERYKLDRSSGIPVRRIVSALPDVLPVSVPPTDSQIRYLAECCDFDWAFSVAWAWQPMLDWDAGFKRASQLGVLDGPLEKLLSGKDLLALGLQQSPEMGVMMAAVRKAQLDGVLTTRAEALRWIQQSFDEESKGA